MDRSKAAAATSGIIALWLISPQRPQQCPANRRRSTLFRPTRRLESRPQTTSAVSFWESDAMTSRLRAARRRAGAGLICCSLLGGPLAQAGSAAPATEPPILVEGNQRIDADTIRTYFHTARGQA